MNIYSILSKENMFGVVISCVLFLTGCASGPSLHVYADKESADDETRFLKTETGNDMIVSVGKKAIVSMMPHKQADPWNAKFTIKIKNISNDTISFGFGEAGKMSQPVPKVFAHYGDAIAAAILTPEQAKKQIEGEKTADMLFQALLITAASGGQMNAGAVAAAGAEIARNHDAKIEEYSNTLMEATEIKPGEIVGGFLLMPGDGMPPLEIIDGYNGLELYVHLYFAPKEEVGFVTKKFEEHYFSFKFAETLNN